MRMKLSLTLIFNLLILSILSGCLEENIPRNRPDLRINSQTGGTGTGGETGEEEETPEDPPFSRPDNAVVILSDHCECEAGVSVGLGNCANFCAGQSNVATRNIFFNIQVNSLSTITKGRLNNIQQFCQLQDDETVPNGTDNPSCILEARLENGTTRRIEGFSPVGDQTFFSLPLDPQIIPTDQTIRVSIVEQVSGARSSSVQIRLRDPNSPNRIAGLLTFMPVNEYACMIRTPEFDEDTGALVIESARRFHFYFIDSTRPEPLQAGSLAQVYCHDIEQSPTVPLNSPLLEERTGVFTVWNATDPRFFDLDGNQSLDINDIIQENVEKQGSSLTATPNFFFPLTFPSGLDDGDSDAQSAGENEENQGVEVQRIDDSLGFAMTPFLDDRTFRSYCPTKQHYYSNNAIFSAMRDVVGVGTEALYIAKQDNVTDCILVNESLISQIRFFRENGVAIRPTPDTIRGKQIQFYWPADINSPFIKKSHQRTYTIIPVDEVNSRCNGNVDSAPANNNGVRTQLPSHDNRIGCIPVLE